MTDPQKAPVGDDVEVRRNMGSGRKMTLGRKLTYAVGKPILRAVVRLLWATCRVQPLQGQEHVDALIQSGRAHVPCYWHRDILICLMTMRGWISQGFKAGVIISASVDGEVPASIARSWGATVIRGSATRTGALAMREMHQAMKSGTSIISAADGPVGPAYYFKPGVILTSRIGSAPLLPIGCAADRAWHLKRWDDFMIPKPFSRIMVTIGAPHALPRVASKEDLETARQAMENAVNELVDRSKAWLANH